ncbi:uncharacterized protein TNCV_4103471 [Trichonephila clavipes]|nr:uncharacterized protein TNCV_4103471 [Trichonephila clavipes]
MLVALFVSILGQSVLIVDDAGTVILRYPICAQLKTDLVISQVKVTYQYSIELIALRQWLNYQTDVQSCSQCVWEKHKKAPAVIENCSPDHDYNGKTNGSRLQSVWLQALPWPISDQHTTITGSKTELACIRKHSRSSIHPPMSSGLTPLESQTSMAWSQWNTRHGVPGSKLSLK